MAKIGGVEPITRQKGNLTECTWTTQTTNMMNRPKKKRGRDKPKKCQVPDNKG